MSLDFDEGEKSLSATPGLLIFFAFCLRSIRYGISLHAIAHLLFCLFHELSNALNLVVEIAYRAHLADDENLSRRCANDAWELFWSEEDTL